MRIYTSSFSQLKTIPKEILKINIARWQPKWTDFLNYPKLYPPVDLLMEYKDGRVSEEEYTKIYNDKVLKKLNFSEILIELKRISNGNDMVFLCYEAKDKFCHRHLVGDWFNANGEINVKEWEG